MSSPARSVISLSKYVPIRLKFRLPKRPISSPVYADVDVVARVDSEPMLMLRSCTWPCRSTTGRCPGCGGSERRLPGHRCRVARGQGVVGTERRDRVVDLDVEVVDRDRHARRQPRLEHDAVGLRVRRLRHQVQVAALQEVVLASRAVQRAAPTRAAGTPVAMHSASLASGSRPSAPQGSPGASNRLKPCAVNSSTMLAARTARW